MTAVVSVFDLFTIGIGPSSSHTVGPMRAANDFVQRLVSESQLDHVTRVSCALFGSLAATGEGHGTPSAIVAGLEGDRPESCDPALVRARWSNLQSSGRATLGGVKEVPLTPEDFRFAPLTRMAGHPNALEFSAWNDQQLLVSQIYYSIGGGFITRDGDVPVERTSTIPLDFANARELLFLCDSMGYRIDQVVRRNEQATRTDTEIDERLDRIWTSMTSCIDNGLSTSGILPGGLGVQRRASGLAEALRSEGAGSGAQASEWILAFALAVNEENAAGSRVVTAPTNGAAGIVPAIGRYYLEFINGSSLEGIRRYLLTASALGSLFKRNASISGAEGGCQAEIGSASAMAAGGLCGVLGGTPQQVENAAEIAIEHHLGLTCDPVRGLVQVPCIERNAIGSAVALSAAQLALRGDGRHVVSLDTAVETMRQTGADMSIKYKETSTGGLAVNVIEC